MSPLCLCATKPNSRSFHLQTKCLYYLPVAQATTSPDNQSTIQNLFIKFEFVYIPVYTISLDPFIALVARNFSCRTL